MRAFKTSNYEWVQRKLFLMFVIVLTGISANGCSKAIDSKMEAEPHVAKKDSQVIKAGFSNSKNGEWMKRTKKPPQSWFWSHDIDPDHVDDVLMQGFHLMRLSVYGDNKRRRFASVSFKESGIESVYLIDVTAAELDSKIKASGARPVSITADAVNGQPRFALVLHKGSGPKTAIHVDLDEKALAGLIDDQHGIADFALYYVGDVRMYAAIVEERPGPSWVFTNVAAKELDTELRKHDATLVRLRGFSDGGQRRFTAVAELLDAGDFQWYDDIDGDAVAGKLNDNHAYPSDLDAYRDERGVRFTVIMYSDRER